MKIGLERKRESKGEREEGRKGERKKERKKGKGASPVQWLANSTLDLKVVGSNLVQNIRWKWSTYKAMPGSIPAPNSGSFMEKNKKNIGSQMG